MLSLAILASAFYLGVTICNHRNLVLRRLSQPMIDLASESWRAREMPCPHEVHTSSAHPIKDAAVPHLKGHLRRKATARQSACAFTAAHMPPDEEMLLATAG